MKLVSWEMVPQESCIAESDSSVIHFGLKNSILASFLFVFCSCQN